MATRDPLIKTQLDEDILTNDVEYFFTSLTNRFDHANEILLNILEKKYSRKFKAIYIYTSDQGSRYKKDNYIVINSELPSHQERLCSENVIHGQEYEDINLQFSQSEIINKLINNLAKKQEKIFYYCFTSSFIDINHPKLIVVGPKSEITTKYDNKLEQYKLFKELDLPAINFREYPNIKSVLESEGYPFYITALYTSGGCESSEIYRKTDLNRFYSRLRLSNKKKHLVVLDLVPDIMLNPNINAAVINKDDVRMITITDQLMLGNAYLGNIYPSNINSSQRQQINLITTKIGKFLGGLGYKGLFGCDFIINSKGKVFINDLNPRRQGGYLCNLLLSKRINLLEQELLLALDENVEDFSENDFNVDYCWAHSKVKVHYTSFDTDKFKTISKELHSSSIISIFNEIGNEFVTTFYPEGYILTGGYPGYCAFSGKDRSEIERKAMNLPEALLKEILSK